MHILSLICSLIIQVGKFQSVILRKFRPVLTPVRSARSFVRIVALIPSTSL